MLERINPRLYRALQRRFGDVAVSSDGESYIPARTRSMYRRGQFDSPPAFAGEYYKVNCPFCGDTTKRLYINHMFAVVGEDRDDHLYLAHCFNEGCIDTRDVQKELYELIYPFGYGRRVQQAELTLLVPRSKVEPAEVAHVRLPAMLPLSGPLSHQACEYLTARGFDPLVIEAHWGVGYCLISPNSEPRIYSRLVIPIHAIRETICAGGSDLVYLAGWQAREIVEVDRPSPKYLSMKGMRKSCLLYGLPQAIESDGPVVVVEGVTDVWRLGTNGVAAFGKVLHPSQIALIIRHFAGRPLVVFFDADAHDDAVVTAHQIRVKRREWGDSSPVVLATPQDGQGDVADCDHATAWNCVRNALLQGAFSE
jgi:hypothetical protein